VRKLLIRGVRKFEILEWHEARPDDIFKKFPDHFSALDFLCGLMHDAFNMAVLRGVTANGALHANFSGWTNYEVIEQLAWELVAGRVRVAVSPVEIERGNFRPLEEEPEEEDFKPKPKLWPDKKKTWFEIELLDEADQPVGGELYQITLPNGIVAKGYTDSDGMARIIEIDPGECQITFPNLDKEAWERI